MKNNFIIGLNPALLIFLISINVFAEDNLDESLLQENLEIVINEEYKPCSDQSESNSLENNSPTSAMILTGNAIFMKGDEVISSRNARAITSSFDKDSNKLIYYQNATTGFKSFLIDDKISGKNGGISSIKEFVYDLIVPCSESIVSIEDNPEQMIFIFADSDAANKARIAAQQMMAEIEREMALAAFQQKLEVERAAAAASTAIYQSKLAREAEMAARMAELMVEKEIAAFEAKLLADEAAVEMMAEIEREMALAAFQQKLADEKAAAAAATAAYRDSLIEAELAAFEAQLEAELAAQQMMAEIEREMALAAFQQKLEDERAAAAASTAAYQAKLIYDQRVSKILDDLLLKLDEYKLSSEFQPTIAVELIKEASSKLLDEEFVGAISGEIVTVAIHDFCKANLGLSEKNIELFKKALTGGFLYNVGPQVTNGTEFSANRWQEYIDCVGSKR